jgi:hypothetical protein
MLKCATEADLRLPLHVLHVHGRGLLVVSVVAAPTVHMHFLNNKHIEEKSANKLT